jgi:hypothetical protein
LAETCLHSNSATDQVILDHSFVRRDKRLVQYKILAVTIRAQIRRRPDLDR